MGYYSRFEIRQMKGPVVPCETLSEELEKISNGYTFDSEGDSEDTYKWYEYQANMRAFSKSHPDTLFRVHREGEEAGDIEDTYYKDGKLVHTETLKSELPVPDLSKY